MCTADRGMGVGMVMGMSVLTWTGRDVIGTSLVAEVVSVVSARVEVVWLHDE